MDVDKETQEKIQELQASEHNLQRLMMQKQAFQMELTETENAISEISKTGEDVFKLVGQIMIKSDKKKIQEELSKKQELLSLRVKSLEKQEAEITKSLEELKKEVMKKLK